MCLRTETEAAVGAMGELLQARVELKSRISGPGVGSLLVHIAKFFLYIRGWLPMPYDQFVEQCRAKACCSPCLIVRGWSTCMRSWLRAVCERPVAHCRLQRLLQRGI